MRRTLASNRPTLMGQFSCLKPGPVRSTSTSTLARPRGRRAALERALREAIRDGRAASRRPRPVDPRAGARPRTGAQHGRGGVRAAGRRGLPDARARARRRGRPTGARRREIAWRAPATPRRGPRSRPGGAARSDVCRAPACPDVSGVPARRVGRGAAARAGGRARRALGPATRAGGRSCAPRWRPTSGARAG